MIKFLMITFLNLILFVGCGIADGGSGGGNYTSGSSSERGACYITGNNKTTCTSNMPYDMCDYYRTDRGFEINWYSGQSCN